MTAPRAAPRRRPATGGDRDQFLDQWMVARGEKLQALVDLALRMIEHVEGYYGKRKRRRRQADERTHRELVEAIACNLAYVVVAKAEPKTIAVSLSRRHKPTRYDRRIFRQLPRALRELHANDLLILRRPKDRHRTSTMKPSPWFERKVVAAGVGFEDFGRHTEEELIVLTRMRRGFKDGGEGVTFGKSRERVDYREDTAASRRFRAELHRLNAFLAEAEMTFLGKGALGGPVDTNRRQLKRYFSVVGDEVRFDLGGRLFGGWWQNVPKTERHRIRVNGEPVVDLDYAGMFPRLGLLEAGLEPPQGDLYAIQGLANCRAGVKQFLNALIFAPGPMTRMPADIGSQFPRGWSARKVRAAILAEHPGLEKVIERGRGLSLMFTESQTLVAVLLRLVDEGVVPLGMHDGLMVRAAARAAVRRAMEEVALQMVGFRLPVTERSLGT